MRLRSSAFRSVSQLDALAVFFLVQDFLKDGMVHAQHHVRIHLDEAAIAVIGEALVAGQLRQTWPLSVR